MIFPNLPLQKVGKIDMKSLSYKRVFSEYELSLSEHFARFAYFIYKKARLFLARWIPLNSYEKYCFAKYKFKNDSSSDMPLGYNYKTKSSEDGYLNLLYVDFYDYLPKEDLEIFKKALKRLALHGESSLVSPLRNFKHFDNIDEMGTYTDHRSFSLLYVGELTRSKYLKQFSSQVAISIKNLSSSFLVIDYRFYIAGEFNKKLNAICKTHYASFSTISRPFGTPWYMPKKFGSSFYTGDDARKKEVYTLVTNFKWQAFIALKRYFTIYFEKDFLFPPTFDTYSTNIRPNDTQKDRRFWNSVMWGVNSDYAPRYNVCVCWDYRCGLYEGMRLSAYCGGSYSDTYQLSDAIDHELSNIYAVYMTANSIKQIAERDIAICNKKISKAIRKAKSSSILKVRVWVEKKLYYSYRFISKFTGDTIDYDDVKEFYGCFRKRMSISKSQLKHISESTAETKRKIDVFLHILNDAAEYESSKSNFSLQWFMMIVTIISLIVAIMALFGVNQTTLNSLPDVVRLFFLNT